MAAKGRKPRILVGEISHETNTFSPIRTTLPYFAERHLFYGPDMINHFTGTHTGVGGYIDAAARLGFELIPSVAASATPSGTVAREAFDHMLGIVLETARQAMASPEGLDGVALCLHGAMVIEGSEDGEGEILEAVRGVVGPDIPVVATLDLHGNITEKMIKNADAFFGFDTNPHVDGYERAEEAADLLAKMLAGGARPVMAMVKAQMMPPTINMRTAEGPMVELFQMARKFEAEPGVVNVSVFGGFPFADIHDAGTCCVAVVDAAQVKGEGAAAAGKAAADAAAKARAAAIAKAVTDRAWEIRDQFLKPIPSPAEAVKHAIEAKRGPVILADVADNMGGGGSGDTTVLLAELLRQGAQNVGFAVIVDPASIARCAVAGVGRMVDLELGGKEEPKHGAPLKVRGYVKAVTDGVFVNKGPMGTGVVVDVGGTAVVRLGVRYSDGAPAGDDDVAEWARPGAGIDVLITGRRAAPNDPEIYRAAGITPEDKHILIVKSRGHFRAAYEPLAAEIVEVDCPGFASPNLSHFEYKKVRRPLFPLDRI